jgi:hypothetical protein
MASIVVGLTIALILYAKHRRRVAKHGTTAVDHDANTVSPFMLSTQMDGHTNKTTPRRGPEVRSVSRSTIARQHLETELRMVHEKMVDLQHRETDRERSSTGPTAGSRTHRMLRLPSMRRSSTRGSPDVQAQLEASREQIDMLVMRIHALEANANSPYGARVSNELPPSYV